jgi:hypothetical protein
MAQFYVPPVSARKLRDKSFPHLIRKPHEGFRGQFHPPAGPGRMHAPVLSTRLPPLQQPATYHPFPL